MGQKKVKNPVFKSYDGPFGMLKEAFFALFEPVVTCFGSWKIPKRFENGLLCHKRSVNSG